LATDLPRDTPLIARQVADSSPVGVLIPPMASLGWMVIGTTSPRPAPRLLYSDLGVSSQQQSNALTSLGWATIDNASRPHANTPSPVPFGWEAPLVPFVSPSVGWLDSSKPPVQTADVTRPSVVDPVGSLLSSAGLSSGWMTGDLPARSAIVARSVDVSQPHLLGPLAFGGAPWGDAVNVNPPVRRSSALAPAPIDPPAALFYLSASTGWLNVADPPRQPVAVRRPDAVSPVGTQFAPFLPGIGWLATDNPRTPYRSQPSAPVDPVGNLLFVPPLPNQSWLYATPDPRTPYRSQRAVVVDPVGSAFPFLPAFGPHWYVDARRPSAVANTPPIPSAPSTALTTALASIGWMVVDGRVVVRAVVRPSAPFNVHLSALQFGGAPWGDVPLARAVLQNRPVLASVDPLAPLAPPSFGWHAVELRTSRTVATPGLQPVDPFGPLVTPLSSLGWQVVEQAGRRRAVVRPLEGADPLSALAPAFTSAPWVSIEPTRRRTTGGMVATVEPVGAFIPPVVLPSLAWLVANTPLPRAFQPRIIRPEPSVVYGSVRVVVLPPLVPDGEQFTWHVPDESLVSIVQFDYRRRR
jgi:hypothetical protein